jgi:hypothetical protein
MMVMKKNFKFEKENFKKSENPKKDSRKKREKRSIHIDDIDMEEYDEKEL